MEAESPTMPDAMYLKYLHSTRVSSSSQGRIYHAVYQEDREQVCCPHCKSNECSVCLNLLGKGVNAELTATAAPPITTSVSP